MSRGADKEDSPESSSFKEACFGEKARKWAFFFIIALLAILTIKDVIELVAEYCENPKESDINIVFNESMSMPNITFCMSRNQAWSHFKINASAPADEWDMIVDEAFSNMTDHDSFLTSLWDYRLVMEAYDMIATYNSMERETTGHGSARSIDAFRSLPRLAAKRATFKKWHNILETRKVSFAEFTQKTGSEVLRRSMQRFERQTFDQDLVIKTSLRTSWISNMQICYQPLFHEEYAINDQGNFFTMLLSHNQENLDGVALECMSVDFHGRPSSLNRFMEGKGRAKDGFTSELCAGQRHEVTVEVRALYDMLENDEEGTACKDQEEGEDTEFDCRSRCRMEMIRGMCNCTAHSLSYLADDLDDFPLCDYTQCEVDVQRGNYSDSECSNKCLRDCHQIRFDIDHEVQGKMVRSDLTLINLNWGSFEYLSMEQQWKYSVTAFIAALGGSIGMWLGLSILSLIQGGTYLYTWCTRKVVKEKILKKHSATGGGKRRDSKISDSNPDRKVSKISIAANPFESPFTLDDEKNGQGHIHKGQVPLPGYSRDPNPTKIQVD